MPYTKNGNINIYYEVEGNGPPLVLHHGFSRSLNDWKSYGYVEELKNEYRLILMDARGHGKSDKPDRPEAYTMNERAGDVTSILDNLGIEKTYFFGYSYGGRVAYELGRCIPERIASLIIGGCGAGPLSSRYVEEKISQLQHSSKAILTEDIQTSLPRFGMQTCLPTDVIDALTAILKQPWADLENDLPKMTMPVLLFGGESDYALPGMLEAVKYLPDVEFISFPGLDHQQTISRIDLIAPVFREFLRRVDNWKLR
ncbi:alpha/beta fold hydrolase [Chloroflexota bacterium]